MIPDNQLASGIQSKCIQSLGAEPPVDDMGGKRPNKTRGLGGPHPPDIKMSLFQYKIDRISKINNRKNNNNNLKRDFSLFSAQWESIIHI